MKYFRIFYSQFINVVHNQMMKNEDIDLKWTEL